MPLVEIPPISEAVKFESVAAEMPEMAAAVSDETCNAEKALMTGMDISLSSLAIRALACDAVIAWMSDVLRAATVAADIAVIWALVIPEMMDATTFHPFSGEFPRHAITEEKISARTQTQVICIFGYALLVAVSVKLGRCALPELEVGSMLFMSWPNDVGVIYESFKSWEKISLNSIAARSRDVHVTGLRSSRIGRDGGFQTYSRRSAMFRFPPSAPI